VSRDAQFFRKALSEKDHRPRGSVEGRLQINMAVLIGCQVSADWHARLRLTARIAMASRDGTVAEHRLAVRRLAEGGKRREKGVFTDGDSRF